MSCCNMDSDKVCKYENIPRGNSKKKGVVSFFHNDGCSKVMLRNLRKSVKFPIILSSSLNLILNICMIVLLRLYCSHIYYIENEGGDTATNEKHPAYLIQRYEQCKITFLSRIYKFSK